MDGENLQAPMNILDKPWFHHPKFLPRLLVEVWICGLLMVFYTFASYQLFQLDDYHSTVEWYRSCTVAVCLGVLVYVLQVEESRRHRGKVTFNQRSLLKYAVLKACVNYVLNMEWIPWIYALLGHIMFWILVVVYVMVCETSMPNKMKYLSPQLMVSKLTAQVRVSKEFMRLRERMRLIDLIRNSTTDQKQD